MKYFKRIISGPYSAKPDDWYRGYIFRASDNNEFLEEYIKLEKYKHEWGFSILDIDGTTGPWFKTQYYAWTAGTGKGSCFEKITEAEAFIELL